MSPDQEVFDPLAVVRLAAAVAEATAVGASFATARREDVAQVLRQLDYARASRLLLANGSAGLRARADAVLAGRDEARSIARRMWAMLDGGPMDPLREWVCPLGVPAWLAAGTPEDASAPVARTLTVGNVDAALERAEQLGMCERCDAALATCPTAQGKLCRDCRDQVYPSDAVPSDGTAVA